MTEVEMREMESGGGHKENDASSSSFQQPWSLSSRSTTIGSHLSNRSWRPKSLLRRLTTHKTHDSWHDAMEKTGPIGRREFLVFISREVEATIAFQDSALWYTTFLENKLHTFWTLCRRNLANVNQNDPLPSASDETTAYRFLIAVAKKMASVGDLALVIVVDSLINEGILRDAESKEDRETRSQLVFAALGWLSMLYEPRALPDIKPDKPNRLNISKHSFRSSGERLPSKSRDVRTRSQDFEAEEQPLHNMLEIFGKLIPDLTMSYSSGLAPKLEFITANHLCYHTLRKVCHVEIEWVETLNMHMEFDSAKKVLKIYRFPSFCRLMYRHKKQRGPLDQLFNDKANYRKGGSRGFRNESSTTRDFFTELLLTYRLIFSQNPQSWRLFSREISAVSKSILSLPDSDPLIPILCGRPYDSSEAMEVYDYVRADDIQAYYSPTSFPFFGERILRIQGFVATQNPRDWRSLWHDKYRNKTNWWAFWAVLFIGGGTIILMIMSLVLQSWQVWLAEEQLKQGLNNGPPV